MRLTRRTFVTASAAAAAAELFGAGQSDKPNATLENLGDTALREARKLKASYCDIRIVRYRDQSASVRLSPERGTGKTLEVPSISDMESFGFGVRVIADGAWGFAASPVVTPQEIARITGEALTVAKANATMKAKPVVLAPVKAYRDRWICPHEQNPFDVPIAQKLETVLDGAREVKKQKAVLLSTGSISSRSEDKYFASSEGSSIQQLVIQTFGSLSANAVDLANRKSKTRNFTAQPMSAGYEIVREMNFRENAQRIREEVLEHLKAPPVKPGRYDLVLMPSNLFLTIHESIGHSTELDRVLGFEANYAGTSFLTVDKLRKERIGADIVNVYGDRTTPRGLATAGYDDDGVKTMKFPIVSKGILVGFQTIRDQAPLIGDKESNACCYADSWASVPFQRMPNVSLAPGPDDVTLEDLIGGIENGILIEGRGSWSIDQQRYNFQFGGDAFYEIRSGRRGGMISQAAYQSRTTDFWQACDGIAGASYWQLFGSTRDGKGEPGQINAVSHGCSPARFRGINVIQTD